MHENRSMSRPMGTECEYNTHLIDPDQMHACINLDAMRAAGVNYISQYVGASGGSGRIYWDCGHHEFCTGECCGPASLAVEDQDGSQDLGKIVIASNIPFEGIYRAAGLYLRNENEHVYGVTRGYHENYQTRRIVAEGELLAKVLPTSIVSRLWAMGGTVMPDGFNYSQKIHHCGGDPMEYSGKSGRRATRLGTKPMILIPAYKDDASIMRLSIDGRVEVRNAEPGHSLVARYLNFATTSLMLRLIENPGILDKRDGSRGTEIMRDLELIDIQAAARVYASDLTLQQARETAGGNRYTALDIQDIHVDWFERLVEADGENIPLDEREAVPLIREVIGALRESHPAELDYSPLAKSTIDFVQRHLYVAKSADKGPIDGSNMGVMQRNIVFDRVVPEGRGRKIFQHIGETDPRVARIREHHARLGLTGRAVLRASVIDDPDQEKRSASWSFIRSNDVSHYMSTAHQTEFDAPKQTVTVAEHA